MTSPTLVTINCIRGIEGVFEFSDRDLDSAIWARLKLSISGKNLNHVIDGTKITLSWADSLTIIRELGTRSSQREFNFRFNLVGEAKERVKAFIKQVKTVKTLSGELKHLKTALEIEKELLSSGFTKRKLKDFQLRDLTHLLSLENGANFSVPGAGKTTVTFALHILTRTQNSCLIVVAPKAANQAWRDVVLECMDSKAPNNGAEPFVTLDGDKNSTYQALNSGSSRFIISYDLLIRQQSVVANHLSLKPTHLILDESHRMKAGWLSQRGAFLLNIASLPIRRDILTGTPMPQAASDIQSQLDFLWPGHGLGLKITYGLSPRKVLGNLYVRTTKSELGLPPAERFFVDIEMEPGQLALYSIVRNEFLRRYSKNLSKSSDTDIVLKARKSVMRLLQLSANPVLALNAMTKEHQIIDSSIIDLVLEEGVSAKMKAVVVHARKLKNEGKKCVIWTIFTDSIETLAAQLADLNPAVIHGGVPSGDEKLPETREGQIKRFHLDEKCNVLIANPAAAGEGISLHKVCHTALYLDRSYVSTHYLQSIDRIHRLGLDEEQDTHIYIYRSKAPAQVGSVDLSVSRRLAEKIRNMQNLLDDPDLHQIALDEENADDPIDYDVRIEDIIDLISELEGTKKAVELEG